jgi:hypothetical protein
MWGFTIACIIWQGWQHMKRFCVPIDRHPDGQLTEVLRKIVLVMPYRH